MTSSDDELGEMFRLPFDAKTADRFLGGEISPEDAPPQLRGLAALIQAAKPHVLEGTSPIEATTVAALAASADASNSVIGEGKKNMFKKILTVQAAAVAAGALVLGATAAAAATGSLPTPAQSAVSQGLSHIGISVPNPNNHDSTNNTGGDSTTPTTEAGRTITTENAFGQCTAWAAANNAQASAHRSSNAPDLFPNLTAAALAKGETIQVFCASVSRPNTTTTNAPATGGATTNGANTSNPPVSVPAGSSVSHSSNPPVNVPPGPPAGVPAGSSVSHSSNPPVNAH